MSVLLRLLGLINEYHKCVPLILSTSVVILILSYVFIYREKSKAIKTTMFNGWPAFLTATSALTFQIELDTGPYGKGKEMVHTHLLLSEEECEEMMKRHEICTVVGRKSNPVVRWESNVVPSNTVCEDYNSSDLISGDGISNLVRAGEDSFWERWSQASTEALSSNEEQAKAEAHASPQNGGKDLFMASLFDGHYGSTTSQLLSKVLHPCLAYAAGLHSARHDRGENHQDLTMTISDV